MKIDENLFVIYLQKVCTRIFYNTFYLKSKSDDDLFYFSPIFTLRASRRLPYAALPARHREPLRRGGRVKGSK
jgi:hypothetical protein